MEALQEEIRELRRLVDEVGMAADYVDARVDWVERQVKDLEEDVEDQEKVDVSDAVEDYLENYNFSPYVEDALENSEAVEAVAAAVKNADLNLEGMVVEAVKEERDEYDLRWEVENVLSSMDLTKVFDMEEVEGVIDIDQRVMECLKGKHFVVVPG